MAEHERKGPTHVRVTTLCGELCAHTGTPDAVGFARSWEVPRRQWEQYVAHRRATERLGESILDLAGSTGSK